MVPSACQVVVFPIRSVYLSEAVLRCSFLGYSSPPRSSVSWLTRIDARTMRLSASAIVPQVPGKGLEPSCLYRAADFESAAAAISPPGRIADMHSFHLRRSVQEKPCGTDGSCSAQNADNKKGAPCGAPFGVNLVRDYLAPRIASLAALATRNFTTFLALIWMVSPVAGLRPRRALR